MTLSALLFAASLAGAPLPPPALLHPCTDPKALGQGEQRLNALAAEIEQVTAETLEHANASLAALMASKCFEFAALENEHVKLPAKDAEVLRLWWKAGGGQWLRSYLTLAKSRRVVVPPDLRTRIRFSERDGPGLRGLLCSEAGCGDETAEWLRRADEGILGRFREAEDHAPRAHDVESCNRRPWRSGEYGQWRECVEAERPRPPMLPLGTFREPKTGWVVISGRRGHYDFCDELRAYDLVTGAAHIAKSCSGLHLVPGGHVDMRATDDARELQVSRGTVNVEKLREFVLVAALQDHVVQEQVVALDVLVPKRLIIELSNRDTISSGSWGSGSFNTGQTLLSWHWVELGQSKTIGELTWPDSSVPADDYATHLLAALEATFKESPPPAHLTPELLHAALASGPPGVSHLDADAEGLWNVNQKLVDALLQNPAPPQPPRP